MCVPPCAYLETGHEHCIEHGRWIAQLEHVGAGGGIKVFAHHELGLVVVAPPALVHRERLRAGRFEILFIDVDGSHAAGTRIEILCSKEELFD